jgi:alkanesulfonate monooxygenase SsuD/methylene tetrahydromethanopterin reductase-like flavin-dependent oxidoreductase (luciferase family)
MVLFGLDVPTAADPGADPVAEAVAAEAAGFDFVSASDHPSGSSPSYEVWTMLSWVAARTSRIRVATRVLGVPYRHPAIVAKMAETLDRLSGGRLILGLGGGASDDEFRAFGIGVPSPRDKVDGLAEAVQITRGLWSQREFSFRGRRYHTDAAELEPKPARRIPIWLGTFGNRALEVTGRVADGWIPSLGFAPPERIPAMRERILAGARAAGRDQGEITFVYNVEVRVDDRAEPRLGVVTGPPATVAEQLAGFLPLGFTALNLKPFGPDRAEQVVRLAEEVIPAVGVASCT